MTIEEISESKRKQIIKKSVDPLPNNPSKAGYKADEIKKAMFGFVTDEKDSIIAEINRIINEINFNFDNIDLSDYDTKEEVRNLIKDFITNNTNELENYYTKKQIEASLATNADLSKKYTDERVAELIDSAPETLDTFKEIADAFKEDQEVLDALNSAIGNKVDKVEGKGLSTNDYTTAEKTKLAGIEEGANNYNDIEIRRSLFGKADKSDTYTKTEVDELITEAGDVIVDDVLSETSENPIQNKVVTNTFANTVTIDTEQTITASKTLEYCGLKHTTIANPSSSNASIFSSFPSVYDRNGNNLGGMEFQYNNLNKWFGMALYAGVAHDVHLYPNKSLGIYKDANGNTITQAPTPSGSNNNEIATTGYVNESLGEYVTETELAGKGYLTGVPSQYITETELENRLANFTSGATITIRRWS